LRLFIPFLLVSFVMVSGVTPRVTERLTFAVGPSYGT
jgi:hypothetical protein